MIVFSNPEKPMKEIKYICLVKDSSKIERDYYTGNYYKIYKSVQWLIKGNNNLNESIHCIEIMFGYLPRNNVLVLYCYHPNIYTFTTLNDEEYQNYQIMIVILNWVVCLGRIDVCFTV